MALGGAVAVCLATVAGPTLTPALTAVVHRRIPPLNVRRRRAAPLHPAASRDDDRLAALS